MNRSKFAAIAAASILWAVCLNPASAQNYQRRGNGVIDAGTNITVRTNEVIRANGDDGRVYSGVVQRDVPEVMEMSPLNMVLTSNSSCGESKGLTSHEIWIP